MPRGLFRHSRDPVLGRAGLGLFALMGLFLAALLCLSLAWNGPTLAWGQTLVGLAGLALAVGLGQGWARGGAFSDGRLLFRLGLIWGLGLYLFLVFYQESAFIGSHLYFWLEDDAMVAMRYGARLA
ncbi:MAG: hypothetical protein ACREKE_01265, partial [bacterium]